MASKKFPAEVFIRNADSPKDATAFPAFYREAYAILGDGPTEIGVYRLVGVVKASKKLVVEQKTVSKKTGIDMNA